LGLPTYNEALEKALAISTLISDCEKVALTAAVDRVLAESLIADRNLPPYNRSKMDGYAVVASEVKEGVSMEVTARVPAGSGMTVERKQQTCVAIATGAPVPPQFDAVVQHELTDRGDLSGDHVTFHVETVKVGKSIHKCGVDAIAGNVLIEKGTKLAPHHIGIAATTGDIALPVVRKPKVIVLTSGDEVVSPKETPEPHQIRNGNGPMITALFDMFGCEIVQHQHLQDVVEQTVREVSDALQKCDLLITVGGISAGDRDFFPHAFEQLNLEFAVKGASIQPGKPVMIGTCANTTVLGLPGNPVSALACAHLFGLPIVLSMLGTDPTLQWMQLPLSTSVIPNKHRTAFRPCNIVDGKIVIPSWQGSGDLSHTANTIGIAQLPILKTEIPAGELVPCFRF
jgi:molybdopterin molybdotransferase